MKKFKVHIGYSVSFDVEANNEIAAEEEAWGLFTQSGSHYPIAVVEESLNNGNVKRMSKL